MAIEVPKNEDIFGRKNGGRKRVSSAIRRRGGNGGHTHYEMTVRRSC